MLQGWSCTYSFLSFARYAIRVVRDENRVARDAIRILREGDNLLFSSTVAL